MVEKEYTAIHYFLKIGIPMIIIIIFITQPNEKENNFCKYIGYDGADSPSINNHIKCYKISPTYVNQFGRTILSTKQIDTCYTDYIDCSGSYCPSRCS